MRFQWRLQRILDVKKKLEKAKEAELGQIQAQVDRKKIQVVTEQEKLLKMLNEIAACKPAERFAKQVAFSQFSKAIDEDIDKLRGELGNLEKLKAEKMQELLAIRQSNESLEKMRQKTQDKFLYDENKSEQKELDETASVRFVRAGCGI